jgi:hypothetical protein
MLLFLGCCEISNDSIVVATGLRRTFEHEHDLDRSEGASMSELGVSQIEFDPCAHLGSLFETLQSDSWHTDDNGAPQTNGLTSAPGQLGPVVNHLRLAIQPARARPEHACKIFLNHVALALHAYCAHVYGEARLASQQCAAAWLRGSCAAPRRC